MKKVSRFNGFVLYTDGSLTPQGAGAGIVLLNLRGKVLHLENKRLKLNTNNEAEYAALILGLEIALRFTSAALELRLDSEVVVNQMLGNFAVKSQRLKQLHWQACELSRQFAHPTYFCIPREENALADALAAEASAGRIWSMGGA